MIRTRSVIVAAAGNTRQQLDEAAKTTPEERIARYVLLNIK